jgi:hypothetical protein
MEGVTMKIIELRADNFRRLKAVAIRPTGDVVQIAGANGQGKTSVLDSIWVALKGRAVAGPEPIRKSEERATIRLDLGELTVWRTFSRDKSGELTTGLKVTMADGMEVRKSPQAVLDALMGDLSFDPLAFARADAKAQFDMLKRLVPDFDFDENASERKRLFDERTDVNRLAKRDRASAANIILPIGDKPTAPDVGGKVEELRRAGVHNAEVASRKAERDRLRQEANSKFDEAERLRARAMSLENEARAADATADAMVILERIDTGPLAAEIMRAEATNGIIVLFNQREALERSAHGHELKSANLTNEITALDEAKIKAIAKAKLPVDRLTLEDDAVKLNGLPFSQASHAEKLVASTAIAMALNPKLRVIRCYEGSTLDSKSLGIIAAMAKSRDYQVFIETVDETGNVGILIEDGEVAAVNGKPTQERSR